MKYPFNEGICSKDMSSVMSLLTDEVVAAVDMFMLALAGRAFICAAFATDEPPSS